MALKLMAEIGLDGSGIQRGMNQVRGQISGLAASIGAAFSVGAVTAFAKKTIEAAGHITDLSARLGVSTSYLQEMQYVMKQNGGSVDDLTTAFEKMGAARIKALEGDADAQANFAKFGISQQDLKTKSTQDIMDAVASKFKEFGRNDVLVSAFKEMGGRGAAALIPAFVDGLEAGRASARESGAVMSQETVAQLDEVGDALDRFALTIQGNIAPYIVDAVNLIVDAGDNLAASSSYLGALLSQFDLMKIIKANFSIEGIKGGGGIGEFARQLGGSSLEAEKAFDQSVAEADKRKEEAAKKRAAKIAEQNKPQEVPEVVAKAKKPEIAKAIARNPAFTDSLVSVGNFLGAGRGTLENIAQKQLKAAEKTNVLLERLVNKADKPAATINVPKS